MEQIVASSSGRPRDPDIEGRAIRAAYEIMADCGYEGLSFAKVSALSGIARPTLKLRWPTRTDLCIATGKFILDQTVEVQVPDDLSGVNIRALMANILGGLIITLNDPERSRILLSIIAAAHFSDPLGELRRYIISRRGIILRRLIETGMEQGAFSPETDVEMAVDGLNGPIIYRTLITGLPMNPEMARAIVDMVLPPME